MSKLQHEMNNMKEDIKKGMDKMGHAIKHTANDLKADAQGALSGLEMKKDELMDRYESKEFSKKIEKQMKKGLK